MDDIKLFAKKCKRIGDYDTDNKNIQPGYRNGIWHRKKCAMIIMKSRKRHIMEGIELLNKEKIRTLG